ncbi:MAG: hypothetical protein AABX19_03035 [Nanoarchaeota archaeon]
MKKIIILLLIFIIIVPVIIGVDAESSGNITFGVVSSTTSTSSTSGRSSGGGSATSSESSDFDVYPEIITLDYFSPSSNNISFTIKNNGNANIPVSVEVLGIEEFYYSLNSSFSISHSSSKNLSISFNPMKGTSSGVYVGKIIVKSGEKFKTILLVINFRESSLLDINVKVLPDYKSVYSGDDIISSVLLHNSGTNSGLIHAAINFTVIDFDRNVLVEYSKEEVDLGKELFFTRKFFIPSHAGNGRYIIVGALSYGNSSVYSYDYFDAVKKPVIEIVSDYSVLLIVIAIMLAIIIYEFISHRNYSRNLSKFK